MDARLPSGNMVSGKCPASCLSSSVVIPTRNRAEALRECLESITRQTRLPLEVVIVDASDNLLTAEMTAKLGDGFACALHLLPARARSLVTQRWQGAEAAKGSLVVFLDDDVVLEPDFISEITRIFEEDTKGEVGGASGVVNDGYVPPSRINALLLRVFVGKQRGSYAGRVVGPAVNFFHDSTSHAAQDVEWLPGGATAYRREMLLAEPCWESFSGYSFLEDVHMSTRVGRKYRLLSTSRARLFHKGLGMQTQTDWKALGESMVLNRHAIAMHVLQRCHFIDYVRLLAYELIYSTALQIKKPTRSLRANLQLLRGKLQAFGMLARGKSPHRAYFT